MRVLSKSRFKLGLECPNKLYYTRKNEYADTKKGDSFLEALAKGGFQVEELARLHYPGGILIEGNDDDYPYLWERTKDLLASEHAVIYEAAFLYQNLFIRTDILVKRGDHIKLIEVKSKSYDPDDEYLLLGKKGGINSGWKSYLFDIAFQKYVIRSCYPEWRISCYLMMANKKAKASVNGLNQLFRITKKGNNRTGIERLIDDIDEAGDPVLGLKDIDDIIEATENGIHRFHDNLSFDESIEYFRKLYVEDQYANWPPSYTACKKCEFKVAEEEARSELKSGFRDCFQKICRWADQDFNIPNTLNIWNFKKGSNLFEQGIIFTKDLTRELIGYEEKSGKLSYPARHWLQIQKDLNNDESIYVDQDGLKNEMSSWEFPLHFIDFETSSSPLPFHAGRSPYERIAFQFSHHIYHEGGRIEHAGEYINNAVGDFPNFQFIRELKNALENTVGSIFQYSNYENSILNAIHDQLIKSDEPDKYELVEFIRFISHSSNNKVDSWQGERVMIDLRKVILEYYYNPLTKGSNSLKQILPASISTSKYLQGKYSLPLQEINVTSKNFDPSHIWLNIVDGEFIDPYQILPPVFDDWSEEKIEQSISGLEEIYEGDAAMVAYGKMQYMDMSDEEREQITKALLKYCELDTLAMVMVYEHLREITI